MRDRLEDPGRPVEGLYGVLGVPPEASREAIVHAYRRQARASHPDARPCDPEATARFRVLTSAYEVLSDPVRRADYDRVHDTGRTARSAPPVRRPRGGSGTAGEDRRAPGPGGARPRLSVPPLWAGPVWVEASSRKPVEGFRGPHPSRGHELDGLASLLQAFLGDWWSS